MIKRKGQVWIETVIYMLIGLSLIGLILAFVLPKVDEQKNSVIIEQTIFSLNDLDKTIQEVIDRGKDNKRIIDFSLKSGEIKLDAVNDSIAYSLKGLAAPYSEIGIKVPIGKVVVESFEESGKYTARLNLEYGRIANLNFSASKINPSSNPYRLAIENRGVVAEKYLIDFRIIS